MKKLSHITHKIPTNMKLPWRWIEHKHKYYILKPDSKNPTRFYIYHAEYKLIIKAAINQITKQSSNYLGL